MPPNHPKNIISKKEELENPTDMAALEWIVSMKEGLRLMKRAPHAITLIRYEDIVESPRGSLTQLLDFCELSSDARFFEYAQQKLRPAVHKGPVDIHPSLRAHFLKTMEALGYANAYASSRAA